MRLHADIIRFLLPLIQRYQSNRPYALILTLYQLPLDMYFGFFWRSFGQQTDNPLVLHPFQKQHD
jgi:hypothetical protein